MRLASYRLRANERSGAYVNSGDLPSRAKQRVHGFELPLVLTAGVVVELGCQPTELDRCCSSAVYGLAGNDTGI